MWFQLKIEGCPVNQAELLGEELEEQGALSIMLTDKNDNPVLEPAPGTTPLWPEVIIEVLYAQAEEAQSARNYVHRQYPSFQLNISELKDKDWERVWMDEFKPQRFGQKLWICPTWHTPPEPHAVNLMLDPGLAFGTGTHPTTSLCLTWLDQADLNNKSIIDYGCGSGVLSLAALKLGAQHCHAVDIDDQALLATRNNALTNTISESLLEVSAPAQLQQSVELIIANILLAPLMSLKERFYQLLQEQGILVVSGILNEQESSLIELYQPQLHLLETKRHDGWSLLVFQRSLVTSVS